MDTRLASRKRQQPNSATKTASYSETVAIHGRLWPAEVQVLLRTAPVGLSLSSRLLPPSSPPVLSSSSTTTTTTTIVIIVIITIIIIITIIVVVVVHVSETRLLAALRSHRARW